MKTLFLSLVVLFLISSTTNVFAGASGGNDRLCWNHDGIDMSGFELSYGAVSGVYTNIVDVGLVQPGSNYGETQDFCSVTFLELGVPEGDWYWNVKAYDAVGNLSGLNGEVDTIPLDLTPPSDPTALIVASK